MSDLYVMLVVEDQESSIVDHDFGVAVYFDEKAGDMLFYRPRYPRKAEIKEISFVLKLSDSANLFDYFFMSRLR